MRPYFLLTYLPTHLRTCLLAYLFTSSPLHLLNSSPPHLLTYSPPHLLTYSPTHLLANLLIGLTQVLKRLEIRLSIPYSTLTIITLTAQIMLSSHYAACLLGMQASIFVCMYVCMYV